MSFEQYLIHQKLSPKTIKDHLRNLERFDKIGTQEEMIEQLETQPTLSQRQAVASTFSKYLQFFHKPNNLIVEFIRNNSLLLQVHTDEKNKALSEDTSLPNTKQLKQRMNELYEKQDWQGFCVMFLFIHYQVRNMDLIAKVVHSKKEMNEDENWFILGKSQVTWIRNKYKTSFSFGQKTHSIKNKKFIHALSHLSHLLKPTHNMDRTIKQITGGFTESVIAKIIIRDNDSINGLTKISKNRGTGLTRLMGSYNITKE